MKTHDGAFFWAYSVISEPPYISCFHSLLEARSAWVGWWEQFPPTERTEAASSSNFRLLQAVEILWCSYELNNFQLLQSLLFPSFALLSLLLFGSALFSWFFAFSLPVFIFADFLSCVSRFADDYTEGKNLRSVFSPPFILCAFIKNNLEGASASLPASLPQKFAEQNLLLENIYM